MRLRGKKGIAEALESQPRLVILQPEQMKGKWHEFFGNDRPLHVELGMGKGKFISEMSARNPDINFIGIDMYDELIRRAIGKARLAHGLPESDEPIRIPNLALVRFNIAYLEQIFAEGEVERFYLNFSDPWPKKRHAKRRLTHPVFLDKYVHILNSRGEIHFKTDSRELFEYSLNTFSDKGFWLRHITLDLHAGGLREDMVQTEYELKFVEQGKPIYRCEALVGSEARAAHAEQLKQQETR